MKRVLIIFLLFSTLLMADEWKKAVPPADKFDWIQTTSGEWLKGEIKGMFDDKLEFDSKEFNLQTIDWEDVQQLKSRSLTSLNIENRGILTGRLYLNGDLVTLITQTETITIKRDQVISLTSGGDTESSYWSGKFALGITLRSGNTKQTEYGSQFTLKRQTANTRFQINYLGNYSKTNDVETVNNQRLNASIDIFQTRRFFWRPAFLEYYRDVFQNIQAKYTYGLGAGYDIYASSRTNWTIFAGPAYQTTDFDTVLEGEDTSDETLAFVLTSDYDIELTKNIDFIVKYQAYFVDKPSGTYIQHALATFETELISDFDLDVTWVWDRIQDPKQNSDGTVPDKDDFKTILSIAYSF